jgi:hypothetical protein
MYIVSRSYVGCDNRGGSSAEGIINRQIFAMKPSPGSGPDFKYSVLSYISVAWKHLSRSSRYSGNFELATASLERARR